MNGKGVREILNANSMFDGRMKSLGKAYKSKQLLPTPVSPMIMYLNR